MLILFVTSEFNYLVCKIHLDVVFFFFLPTGENCSVFINCLFLRCVGF